MTKSNSLEKHQYYLDIIIESTTLPELSAIRTEYTLDPVLTEGQKGVLKSRYEIQEMKLKALYTASPWKSAPAYAMKDSAIAPAERIAITHAQDDLTAFGSSDIPKAVTPAIADEVFDAPDIEIVTVGITNPTPNETPTIEIPSEPIVQTSEPIIDSVKQVTWSVWSTKPKQEKVSKKNTGVATVTLTREIKLPIDGVQFSNNLFNVSLTASTYEEAKVAIEEAFTDFTQSTKLLSKDHIDKAYAQWLADGEKKVQKPKSNFLH